MAETTVRGLIGEKEVVISSGTMAGLANGAVRISMGETEALVTASNNAKPREGANFFPLTIDVEERMYAAGKIPGSFFRREGRATERAILTARLIDRPLRPNFTTGYLNDTHVVATILAVDGENPYDVISLNGASAALSISDLPFEGPIGAVRLALLDGDWVPMPTFQELEDSVFDLVVAGMRNEDGDVDIVMVEAGSTEKAMELIGEGAPASDEDSVARGLEEAKAYIGQLVDLQNDLKGQVGKPLSEYPVNIDYTDDVYEKVAGLTGDSIGEIIVIADKTERGKAESAAKDAMLEAYGEAEANELSMASKAFRALMKKAMRARVVNEGIRLDGRSATDIREITAEVGVIARAHGSALFKRGETQVLNVTTMGMPRMEQMLDTISNEESKRYMHHYNFPPFSTGEAGFMRGPKRREIGHGALAEKAVRVVVPLGDDFNYALRLVSEVLASNGSSSMASVCASTLSLMDAAVPIIAPVAGIAMGVIAQDGEYVTLTDILGAEDALGDMDFKVAGTADVITAMQLDMKIQGLPSEVLTGALSQARDARLKILEVMADTIAEPRTELNKYAPRLEAVQIPKDKIGEIIGPKGKVIRELEEETGATLEIQEDGTVLIGSESGEQLEHAKTRVLEIAFPPEAELGKEYEGTVVGITKFGAFINILPGRDGLLHISKMDANRRVNRVEDYLDDGDEIKVVVGEIDRNGKVSLDLVGEIEPKEGANVGAPREDDRGGGGDRGGRDRDRGESRDRGGRDRDRGESRDRGGRDRDRGGSRDRGGNRDRDGSRDRDGNRDRDGSRDRDGNRDRDGSRDRGGRDGNRDRGGNRDGGGRGRNGGGNRDRGGSRDRGGNQDSGRKMVSFEDAFEDGIE